MKGFFPQFMYALFVMCLVGCGSGSTSNTSTSGAISNGSTSGTSGTSGSSSGNSSSSNGSSSSGAGSSTGSGSGSSSGSSSGSGQATFQSQTYDLGADFSFANSSNGVWQYGYSATQSLAPDQFRLDAAADTSHAGTGFWHPTTSENTGVTSGYYPYVAKNTASTAHTDPSNGWAVRANEVAMEGSGSGQYSLVRFVAPAGGKYQIAASFEGIHFNLSTTDVHILQNTASVFDANIDGYGGDPSFHTVQGANPTANYSGTLTLNAGDIVTFAVGVGANQTVYNDTTGLMAHIVTVP